MAKNKRWSSSDKFEIVLKAIKGETTLNEICERYQIAPSQVHAWKKQFLEQGQGIFDKKQKSSTIKALFGQFLDHGMATRLLKQFEDYEKSHSALPNIQLCYIDGAHWSMFSRDEDSKEFDKNVIQWDQSMLFG